MSRFKELLEKLKWVHVVLAIGLSGAFFYYTLDQSEIEMREQSIELAKAEITNNQRRIEEAKEFERQFEDKKKRYAELVRELQKIQGALPKQFFLPDLLSDLLREAKQLEVEIISIKPDLAETTGELYNSLGFNIEARGTFLQFFILLDRMAAMSRLVHVQSFSVEKDQTRKSVSLGGQEGAFADSKLSGGQATHPGIRGSLRVITYRYRAVTTVSDAGGGG